jgi:hypothetical protein
MPIRAAQHRLTALAALSHTTPPALAGDAPRAASAASAPGAAKAANATKKLNDTPLRFDPPAAGPHRPTRAEYVDCISHPSPDGLYTDCSALLPDDVPPRPAPAAKPR